MGSLNLPRGGTIYLDSQVVVYGVENHPVYAPMCLSFWSEVNDGLVLAASSELTLMETLVLPLRRKDQSLVLDFEDVWEQPNVTLLPISTSILRAAAQLRADQPTLRTPDAIHLATAREHGCGAFLTNDARLRSVESPPVFVLDDYR